MRENFTFSPLLLLLLFVAPLMIAIHHHQSTTTALAADALPIHQQSPHSLSPAGPKTMS
jgi:hypothetical protein